MIISLIAALTKNRVIGKNNTLPWSLPDDMKFFMQKTRHHVVIMGRKNYESIPEKFRPLPSRTNIVVTRQIDYKAPDCIVVNSIEKAIEVAKATNEEEVFNTGGAELFILGMSYARRMYLTEIQTELQGDTFFPEVDMTQWRETSRKHHEVDERHAFAFDFVVYDRLS